MNKTKLQEEALGGNEIPASSRAIGFTPPLPGRLVQVEGFPACNYSKLKADCSSILAPTIIWYSDRDYFLIN